MTETAAPAPPVLTFTTTASAAVRPTVEFMLDDRMVTATAPKAARWARMWAAGASGNTQLVCYEWLRFIDVAIGDEVARWLKDREDDPEDPYDIPDLINLVRFLNTQFEPLLKDEFEASGVGWQEAQVAPLPARADRRATAKAKGGAPRKKPAARTGR
jgi:hypothetical protein